jgi:hypothetical protein
MHSSVDNGFKNVDLHRIQTMDLNYDYWFFPQDLRQPVFSDTCIYWAKRKEIRVVPELPVVPQPELGTVQPALEEDECSLASDSTTIEEYNVDC